MGEELKSCYPYFGGKRRAAATIWRAFGSDVPNFIDPFLGSNSILLARPGGPGKIETINDADRMVANFWRAVKADPFGVAAWCDDPVNEADLHARHRWLVNQDEFRERMHRDPYHYDLQIAGWWIWGICQWIGGGWCVEPDNRKHPKLDGIGKGVHSNAGHADHAKRPSLDGTAEGRGVHAAANHAKRPHLAGMDKGVHQNREAYSPGRRPRMSDAGNGVHLPSLGNDKGIHGVSADQGTFLRALQDLTAPDAPPAFEWFARLALRMRRVRVACGDWRRVLGSSILGKGKNVGGRRPCAVILDPPYLHAQRCPYLYGEESPNVALEVAEWAREHGDDRDLRIALCGYDGDYEMPASWTVHEWQGARGYASADNSNRKKERIWFSPHCLPIHHQPGLFEVRP